VVCKYERVVWVVGVLVVLVLVLVLVLVRKWYVSGTYVVHKWYVSMKGRCGRYWYWYVSGT
jgi:hypothetical protein